MGYPLEARLGGTVLPRVLICNHRGESVSFLQNLLLHWGFEVFTAENSSDASEVMRQTSPSPRILITDISTNAIDFCARLRAGSDYYAYILVSLNQRHEIGKMS